MFGPDATLYRVRLVHVGNPTADVEQDPPGRVHDAPQEWEVELPIVPYAGLVIEIPALEDGRGYVEIVHVVFEADERRFTCQVRKGTPPSLPSNL